MRKALRILALAGGLMLFAAVLLAVLVPRLLSPDLYKDRIIALVKARTGHDLLLGGDIRLSVLPGLALEADTVQLSNAPGFDATPLLRAGHGVLRIRLLPLLFERKLELDQIHLDAVAVHLQRDAQGRTNWQTPASTPDNGKTADLNLAAALALLQLGEIKLRKAQVDWDDRQTGRYYRFSDIELTTTRYTASRPFTLNLKFAISPARSAPAWPVRLVARINADPTHDRYTLDKAELLVGPIEGLSARLTSRADLDLAHQQLDLPDINLQIVGLNLSGTAQVQQILDKPALRGILRIPEFNPRPLLQALGQLPPHAETGVLQRVAGSVGVQASRDGILMTPVSVHIDDTTLTGELGVRDFVAPRWNFNLAVDAINLDRYFPPAASASNPSPPAALLPTEWLRRANVDGTVHIGRLQSRHLLSSDVRFTVKSPAGAAPMPARAQAAPPPVPEQHDTAVSP